MKLFYPAGVPLEPGEKKNRVARWMLYTILALVGIIVTVSVGRELLNFYLNAVEFGELFILPIYFELMGGLLLASVALVRIDLLHRRSITWWGIRLVARMVRERGEMEYLPPDYLDFSNFKLPLSKFILWQITKVLLASFFFANPFFGMAFISTWQGWDAGLAHLSNLLLLPFVKPPLELVYAQEVVIPMIPALTLLVTPVLGALGLRLFILVGATQLLKILTLAAQGAPWLRLRSTIANLEGLVALGLFWTVLNSFFPSYIDFNTPYAIGGLLAVGALFTLFYIKDIRARRWWVNPLREAFLRLGALLLIVLTISSIMAINSSTADALKIQYLGPYIMQEIAVNRYLAQLDNVEERPYIFFNLTLAADQIPQYLEENKPLLDRIRLWDWSAAFAKLKPEIGLIPFVDFQDSDIIRFNGSLYWSASMKPVLPPTVRPEDTWYAQHLVYTHVPNGFLLLNAHDGTIVNSSIFFSQRRIYYGEGGLLKEVWAAFPKDRDRSDEVGGYFYDGEGGVDLPPPLSWLYEANFFLAFRDQTIRVLRYRDVYDRMALLFPYFQYDFGPRKVDMFPVTDGENTYWLMPLILELDTTNVPWSKGAPLMRLVGYALIDIYDGEISILVLGDDFFSQLFRLVYRPYVSDTIPDWLKEQMRYPEELLEWRISMYSFYHITDAATFIVGKEFYEVPRGLDTYYIMAQPPGFEAIEFVGLLSLELRGAEGRNLAGYMVVRNTPPHLGQLIFYKVPLDSPVKLLGPSAVLEALEKNAEFAKLKTLLRSPRIGDIILYNVGGQHVYFIPVYTAREGGVVTELGAVASVGADFTGTYQVGLSVRASVKEAFEALLRQKGVAVPEADRVAGLIGREEVLRLLEGLAQEMGFEMARPEEVNPHVTFLLGSQELRVREDLEGVKALLVELREASPQVKRLLLWEEDSTIKIGSLINRDGIVELYYISIKIEEGAQ